MEPTEAIENICRMESDDNVGLSDIIDILNTLDNQNMDMNGIMIPQEAQANINLPQSSSSSSSAASPPTAAALAANTQPPPNQAQNLHTLQNVQNKLLQKPYIKIVEQPAGKALRFRYECEGRSAGSIPGINSTPENKTFPTIEIAGYRGDVVVVVSCVTKDPPYRPHPHNLVGKEGCKNGICTLVLNSEPLRASFSNLGIQCVKKKDIKSALDMRESMQVDPFKTKFGHKDQPSSIDLNAVRLCFQAFLKTANGVKPLTPVVSDPIYDKKAMSDLVICRLCSCSAKVGGGDEIILLCEKVAKDDIKVKFYELSNEGLIVWEDFAEFQQTDIHKQTAIAFKTPRYQNTDILEKAKVFLQLVRPSDGVTSDAIPFEYYPDPGMRTFPRIRRKLKRKQDLEIFQQILSVDSETTATKYAFQPADLECEDIDSASISSDSSANQIKRKRLKTGGNPMNILRRELQKQEQLSNTQFQNDFKDVSMANANFWNPGFVPDIKTEPALSPQNFGPHRSPYQMSPSPQPLSPMNRNTTPSPALIKSLSGSSQTQMCDLFNYSSMTDHKSPLGQFGSSTQSPQQNNNGNPFLVPSNDVADENSYIPISMNVHKPNYNVNNNNNNNNSNTNNNNNNNNNNNTNGIFAFIDHNTQAPRTSGGSMTPLLQTNANGMVQNMPMLPTMNIVENIPQQQQQSFQHLQDGIDVMANNSTEEGPTLSGLIATFVDSDQLFNLNSDDLPLSNLSIST